MNQVFMRSTFAGSVLP